MTPIDKESFINILCHVKFINNTLECLNIKITLAIKRYTDTLGFGLAQYIV